MDAMKSGHSFDKELNTSEKVIKNRLWIRHNVLKNHKDIRKISSTAFLPSVVQKKKRTFYPFFPLHTVGGNSVKYLSSFQPWYGDGNLIDLDSETRAARTREMEAALNSC